jgi:hypothetical protein
MSQPMEGQKLWTPPDSLHFMRGVRQEKMVTLPNGKKVRVVIEGTEGDGFVKHIESDDAMDAVAYPQPVRKTLGRH